MKKLFFLLACVIMSVLAMSQDNQLVWANGRLLYGTPVAGIDSLTYDKMEDVDTLHLLLPRTLIKVVHDTVYIHDTVYVETDCGGEDDTTSAGIGAFSVGEGKTVTFSQGNLQYHPANNEWRFAENQTDYIGDANSNCSSTYNGWLDLFGWSTSANNFGVSTSEDYNDYSGSFVDWGTNKIGNDARNTWRTLTYEEWEYLLNTRANASSLKGVAQVDGVNGLILLPDNWTCPTGMTFKSGFHSNDGVDYYVAYQTFTADQWSKLEAAGAVFLPAAGKRGGSSVGDVQRSGTYWSATGSVSCDAGGLYFYSFEAGMFYNCYRDIGRSVRLVKDIEGGGTTPDTPTEPEEPENTENGHEYVDLGLSVKWATCNVGATTPEEYGDYFAWGEVEPKEVYDWTTYKWCNGSSNTLTKYNNKSSYGTVDNKTTLELSDDAATTSWGGSWRMPTDTELTELREQCTWTWTTENGVNGYKVTSKGNSNSIFLPAAGFYQGDSLNHIGKYGLYWSSLHGSDIPGTPIYAWGIDFDSNLVSRDDNKRDTGRSVRPVCK